MKMELTSRNCSFSSPFLASFLARSFASPLFTKVVSFQTLTSVNLNAKVKL